MDGWMVGIGWVPRQMTTSIDQSKSKFQSKIQVEITNATCPWFSCPSGKLNPLARLSCVFWTRLRFLLGDFPGLLCVYSACTRTWATTALGFCSYVAHMLVEEGCLRELGALDHGISGSAGE